MLWGNMIWNYINITEGKKTTNQRILIIGFKFVIEIPKNLNSSRFKNPRVILGDENQINITKLSDDYENT